MAGAKGPWVWERGPFPLQRLYALFELIIYGFVQCLLCGYEFFVF